MKVTWMSYFVLLQSEAWRNVQKIVAGHELQVQASDSNNNNMTSLYTWEPCTWLMWSCKSETRSHTWAAQEKKDKQTNKGMRVWGDGGGGVGVKNRKVLTSSGSTPKSLQSFFTPRIRASGVRLILAFVQAKRNKNSTLNYYYIIVRKLILLNYRASFKI